MLLKRACNRSSSSLRSCTLCPLFGVCNNETMQRIQGKYSKRARQHRLQLGYALNTVLDAAASALFPVPAESPHRKYIPVVRICDHTVSVENTADFLLGPVSVTFLHFDQILSSTVKGLWINLCLSCSQESQQRPRCIHHVGSTAF
mmetsp:Transcript_8099/g.28745  ORF Transcript_8099/g.28745 Transcript_8099/m.28745 type:complete len:146 (+) Transcript_8099:168-605(+)